MNVRSLDPSIRVRLSYSSARNVFGRRFYEGSAALLRRPVAQRLVRVQRRLQRQGLGLLVWDAYRPASVHRAMWRQKPGTRYLANPVRGSKHSRGAAVDVTLVDRSGRPLKMPTPHDEFSPRAHRSAVRGVTPLARRNRKLLADAMRAEGFVPNAFEWWHFSAPEWRRYPLADEPPATAPRRPAHP